MTAAAPAPPAQRTQVYDECIFPGSRHLRLADVPNMRDRTLTIGSASKMFSLTGWRIGWLLGPKVGCAAARRQCLALGFI